MDPLTLLAVGPAVIRTVGELFGGKAKETAHKVADVVEAVRGKPRQTAEDEVRQALRALPPEHQVELQRLTVRLEEIAADREKAHISADTEQFTQSQTTIRTEAEHGTDYVKETRPWIARSAFKAGTAYVLISAFAHLIGRLNDIVLPAPDMAIAATLYSPVGFYMTMRTFDAFSKAGKSGG